ncbi:MAG: hypothetical protein ACRC17_00270 [Culicoidibacterales bacterium]
MNWLCIKFGISKSTYYSRIRTRNAKRLKHIEIKSLVQLDREVRIYCRYYNTERLHSRHGYQTIQQVKQQRVQSVS